MDVIPETLKDLVPSCGEVILTSDLSHQQAALIQLRSSLLKKLEPKGANKAADKAALDLFIESNDRCSRWSPDEDSYHFDTMKRARMLLNRRFFGDQLQAPRITLRGALDHARPGPGASRGTKATDFVGKLFNSRLTTYDRGLWEYYRSSIPTLWRHAEMLRELQYGGCDVIDASKLTFAKKNYDISRVINTEANLDMFFQLGIGAQIESCLTDWFNINLSKQPTINRHLARLGSMDASYATIDLKSASDLISDRFVYWFLPTSLSKTLDTVRAKCIELPSGDRLRLNTYATMGNGFTFPLQTLIFACIVEAAYEELGLPTDNSGVVPSFSVFGDDIICVRHAYDKVLGLLEWCGFVVNRTKSFNTGSFRESCGADYYRGRDVRGVYVKKLSHETHFFSVFNRLTRWSIRNGVDLSAALRYVKGLARFLPVPLDAADTAGFKLPFNLSGLKHSAGGFVRFKQYVPEPLRIKTTRYEANPVALEIAALGGYVSGDGQSTSVRAHRAYDSLWKPNDGPVGSITLRAKPDGEPRVKLKRDSTSSWDWIPHKGLTTLDYMIALHSVFV